MKNLIYMVVLLFLINDLFLSSLPGGIQSTVKSHTKLTMSIFTLKAK